MVSPAPEETTTLTQGVVPRFKFQREVVAGTNIKCACALREALGCARNSALLIVEDFCTACYGEHRSNRIPYADKRSLPVRGRCLRLLLKGVVHTYCDAEAFVDTEGRREVSKKSASECHQQMTVDLQMY